MNDVTKKNIGADELPSTEAEWLEKLGPEAFAIMRKQGTERAFTGEFWDKNEQGSYRCKGCGGCCSSPILSSTLGAVGRVSFYRPRRRQSKRDRITVTVCSALKWCVPAAIRIWVMCLTMAQQ